MFTISIVPGKLKCENLNEKEGIYYWKHKHTYSIQLTCRNFILRINTKNVDVVDLWSFENLYARCSTEYYQCYKEKKSKDKFSVYPVLHSECIVYRRIAMQKNKINVQRNLANQKSWVKAYIFYFLPSNKFLGFSL